MQYGNVCLCTKCYAAPQEEACSSRKGSTGKMTLNPIIRSRQGKELHSREKEQKQTHRAHKEHGVFRNQELHYDAEIFLGFASF